METRVVGVITDLRRSGEFSASPYLAIIPARLGDAEEHPPDRLLIKVRPGSGVMFEERLVSVLNRVAPEWTFNVDSLLSSRERMLRFYLLPLLVLGLIAGFLVIMVGLGLIGVLWQSVTRRTSEMGLRRALGGTTGAVRGQIMGELLVLTTLAVGLGTLVVLQLPMLGVLPFLSFGIYLAGLALSLLVTYLVVMLCSLYPSWLATRIHPGTALQHE
jgi:putative ABC transport system permease protein